MFHPHTNIYKSRLLTILSQRKVSNTNKGYNLLFTTEVGSWLKPSRQQQSISAVWNKALDHPSSEMVSEPHNTTYMEHLEHAGWPAVGFNVALPQILHQELGKNCFHFQPGFISQKRWTKTKKLYDVGFGSSRRDSNLDINGKYFR